MRAEELFRWMRLRHDIYTKRQQGLPKPWTDDKILQSYRFCNVYRELDTVTQWIAENWRTPHPQDTHNWFAMVVARLVNWPWSLEAIGYPVPWDPDKFVRVLNARKDAKQKVFTGAYMIHADGKFGGTKAEYLAAQVLTPMWRDRERITPGTMGSLWRFHKRLMEYRDMGSFMAAQVVADVKYHPLLLNATDWWTWAAPGPGSMRGLNRVYGYSLNNPWKPANWLGCLHELHHKINALTEKHGMPDVHAQDLQNCLCEWDKYERVRLGEGKPRSLYPGL